MTTKHTPGPWRFVTRATVHMSEHNIAEVGTWKVCAKQGAVTTSADARLIAAAPDLLEALEAMLATYECAPEYPTEEESEEMSLVDAKARAAIAKATGVTPL